MTALDITHDPKRTSWVASANVAGCDFPIQNLPFGRFRAAGSQEAFRIGVAIGDQVLDLRAAGLVDHDDMNTLMAAPVAERQALRRQISDGLAAGSAQQSAWAQALVAQSACEFTVPCKVGDYTDFYTSVHHATNIGRQFRPDNPLLPNYKWVPIGYHGRASSIIVSGTPVKRPQGQTKAPDAAEPSFGPCKRLDYELELAWFIGQGNALGAPVGIDTAEQHLFGVALFNDWSARDIQAWEYQPLGPFLSKNFASTLSPWVVTPEALAPFRIAQPPRPEGDPAPLPYLLDEADQRTGALDLELEVLLSTARMREQGLPPHRLSLSNTKHMYWTVAQMLAHHTSNGCNLQPGDLLGSGTISAPDPTGFGSLLETTRGGKEPVALPSGESRRFLEDGDEVTLRARARRDGAAPIGFGECRAIILPAR